MHISSLLLFERTQNTIKYVYNQSEDFVCMNDKLVRQVDGGSLTLWLCLGCNRTILTFHMTFEQIPIFNSNISYEGMYKSPPKNTFSQQLKSKVLGGHTSVFVFLH